MLIDPNPNVARVTWTYPDVDPDRKYRNLTREEAAERAQAEKIEALVIAGRERQQRNGQRR